MKIAYLSVFYPFRGGIAQFNGALYRALEKKHEVKAYTFTRQYPKFLFPGKTQYVDINDSADKIPAHRILDSINPASYFRTIRKIREYQPDLLLIQNWMPFFAPSLGWVARSFRKKGIKTISIIANMKPHEPNPGDKMLNKFFLRQSNGFVVMANQVKDDLLELKSNAKYFYHPHPNYEHFGDRIDKTEAQKKLNIPADKKVILFFGLVRKYKGLDILLNAMKDLPDDIYLLVAGEVYGSSEEYDDLIKKNNLASRSQIHFRYLNDDQVPLFFSAADVCVLPYRTATQSGIVGVSYHFGVPVVSTDVGGLKEVIEPYGAGIVIDKPDVQLLNEAIRRYFDEQMADECKQNISNFKEKYTWDSLAEGIIEFSESV